MPVRLHHRRRRTGRVRPGPSWHPSGLDTLEDLGNPGWAWAGLTTGGCGYHTVGTCAMGPDQADVVDPTLQVRGVQHLRVVDASVFPTMISGNLNGPVTALAWRAADLILDG